ncbi:MAG: hypothetical protein ABSC92_02630 [Rhizomicrobium sp.]
MWIVLARLVFRILALSLLLVLPSWPASAGSEKILYTFQGGTDGANPGPYSGLINVGGLLYGTTGTGGGTGYGGKGCGTVFSFTTEGTEKIVYRFLGGQDGSSPLSNLIYVGGIFYGTTNGGGNACSGGYDCGTIFSISPTGEKSSVYNFKCCTDGASAVPTAMAPYSRSGEPAASTYYSASAKTS